MSDQQDRPLLNEHSVQWVLDANYKAVAVKVEGRDIFEWRTKYNELLERARSLVPAYSNLVPATRFCMMRDASRCARTMQAAGHQYRPCPMTHHNEDTTTTSTSLAVSIGPMGTLWGKPVHEVQHITIERARELGLLGPEVPNTPEMGIDT